MFLITSQKNRNSAKKNAALEVNSDALCAEITSIKASLAALIKGRSKLEKLIGSSHSEKKNGSDFRNNSVITTTEPKQVYLEKKNVVARFIIRSDK